MSHIANTDSSLRPAGIRLAGGRQIDLQRPVIMGVVNVTPDSFSDGGRYDNVEIAVQRALEIEGDGATIIDIGGESSRPGADPVPLEIEMQRVLPVIEALREKTDVTISIDTCKAEVARRAIGAGADIVNDISALRFDAELVDVVAETGVPVVLMHMLGSPKDMQVDPHYQDCVGEIADFLRERVDFAVSHGIDRDRIIIDPGIGFGKRLIDNLDILARLRVLKQFSLPLMVGASRKRFIEYLHRSGSQPHERLGGSVAAALLAVSNGADIVRAHDVRETAEALHLLEAVRGSE